jgi:hypothetical protein
MAVGMRQGGTEAGGRGRPGKPAKAMDHRLRAAPDRNLVGVEALALPSGKQMRCGVRRGWKREMG